MTIKSMVRWTEEENARLAEMVAQKMPRKLIARALNRSAKAIHARIEKGMPNPEGRGLSPSAKVERDAIVAWLRDVPWPYRDDALIAAIEAGEHLK